MVYSWNSYGYKVPAQKVGEALEKMEKRDGSLTVESIVNEARPKKSVLHTLFEWDDAKAAEEYRKTQANGILHCLVVRDESLGEEPQKAYVCVTSKGVARRGLFVNIKQAMEQPETRNTVLENAIMELTAFERKYNKLTELENVIKAIHEVTKK